MAGAERAQGRSRAERGGSQASTAAVSHVCLEQEFPDNETTSSSGPGMEERGGEIGVSSKCMIFSAWTHRVAETTVWSGGSREGRALERGGEGTCGRDGGPWRRSRAGIRVR